jgi:hypothetical protein
VALALSLNWPLGQGAQTRSRDGLPSTDRRCPGWQLAKGEQAKALASVLNVSAEHAAQVRSLVAEP